jgi:hypothetical protein
MLCIKFIFIETEPANCLLCYQFSQLSETKLFKFFGSFEHSKNTIIFYLVFDDYVINQSINKKKQPIKHEALNSTID